MDLVQGEIISGGKFEYKKSPGVIRGCRFSSIFVCVVFVLNTTATIKRITKLDILLFHAFSE